MRPDGIRVKGRDPMYSLMPYFLTHRYDSQNMITLDIPVAPLHTYINEKRAQGIKMSHLALILAAYVRATAEFPSLNRFISGTQKIYAHKEFTVAMVVLRPGRNGATSSKIKLEFTDTIFDVQDKITACIETNRQAVDNNRLDRLMSVLLGIPLLAPLLTGILRFLDHFSLLPKAICDVSPFHASLLITNLASIRTNHIFHHVYEFGTTSVAVAMGNLREVPKRTRNGIELERCIPLGVVMDERICGGHYFAQAFSRMKEYLTHPELLEQPPRCINPDL